MRTKEDVDALKRREREERVQLPRWPLWLVWLESGIVAIGIIAMLLGWGLGWWQ